MQHLDYGLERAGCAAHKSSKKRDYISRCILSLLERLKLVKTRGPLTVAEAEEAARSCRAVFVLNQIRSSRSRNATCRGCCCWGLGGGVDSFWLTVQTLPLCVGRKQWPLHLAGIQAEGVGFCNNSGRFLQAFLLCRRGEQRGSVWLVRGGWTKKGLDDGRNMESKLRAGTKNHEKDSPIKWKSCFLNAPCSYTPEANTWLYDRSSKLLITLLLKHVQDNVFNVLLHSKWGGGETEDHKLIS